MVDVYSGQDDLNLHRDYTNNVQRWGNRTASLVWNRLLAPKAFLTSSVNFSQYKNIAGFRYNLYDSTGASRQNRVYNTYSSIQRFNVQSRLEFTATNNVRFVTGLKANFTKVKPFDSNISSDFLTNQMTFPTFHRSHSGNLCSSLKTRSGPISNSLCGQAYMYLISTTMGLITRPGSPAYWLPTG